MSASTVVRTKAAHGKVHEAALLLFLSVEELHQQGGVQGSGAQSIDSYILACVDDGQLTAASAGGGQERIVPRMATTTAYLMASTPPLDAVSAHHAPGLLNITAHACKPIGNSTYKQFVV